MRNIPNSVYNVGACSHLSAVTVTDTAQQISLTDGKRSMEILNNGSKYIYIGGSGVTDSNGIKLFPGQSKFFSNAKKGFNFYVVCSSGETSDLRINEYL